MDTPPFSSPPRCNHRFLQSFENSNPCYASRKQVNFFFDLVFVIVNVKMASSGKSVQKIVRQVRQVRPQLQRPNPDLILCHLFLLRSLWFVLSVRYCKTRLNRIVFQRNFFLSLLKDPITKVFIVVCWVFQLNCHIYILK